MAETWPPQKRNCLILLILFVLIYAGVNLFWLFWDTLPPPFDQSAHTLSVLKYHQLFSCPISLSGTKLFRATKYWPPFFYICSAFVTLALGFSSDAIVLTNFLFLVLLVFVLFKLGENFFNPEAGLFLVFLTMLAPLVFALLRDVLIDFSLLTMVSLVQYSLLKNQKDWRPGAAVFLGLVMGFSFLTKWTSPVFFAFTAGLVFFLKWRKERQALLPVLATATIVVAVALLVSLPWYVKNFQDFRAIATNALLTDSKIEGDPVSFWPSFKWYVFVLRKVIVSDWLLPFFLTGLLGFFLWVKDSMVLAFALSWFLPSFLVFVSIPNKDARFILPVLPSLLLLSATGLASIPWKNLKSIIVVGLLLTGFWQFTMISFGWPRLKEHPYTHRASREDWKVETILSSLEKAFPAKELRLAVLANQPYFNPNLFQLITAMRNLPYKVDSVGDRRLNFTQLTAYHFFILKSGEISLEHTARWREEFRSRFWSWVKEGRKNPRFTLWQQWPLPDGSQAFVYKIERGEDADNFAPSKEQMF